MASVPAAPAEDTLAALDLSSSIIIISSKPQGLWLAV
jgi:hypothetical protein